MEEITPKTENNSPKTGGASVSSGFNKIFFLVTLLLFFISFRFQDKNTIGWEIQYAYQNDSRFINDIKFLDTLMGFAVTNMYNDTAYILRTTNGGVNWTVKQRYQPGYSGSGLSKVQMLNHNTGYIAGGYGNSIVLKTTDGGNNWIDLNFTLAIYFDDMYFANVDTGWVTDATFGGTYRTINGGLSWQQQTGGLGQLSFVNANTGWGYNWNKLYRTTNSGQNWVNIFSLTTADQIGSISFLNDSVGFISATGMSQKISKTINGGYNWTGFANPSTYRSMYFYNSDNAWLGDVFNTIRIIKYGGSLTGTQNTPNFSNKYFSFRDTLKGWAGSSGIIRTTDGGGPITNVGNNTQLTVTDYKLYQNYPNPFNPVTTIKFDVKKNANVTIKVFDIRGREVSTPLNGYYTAGEYELRFDGSKLTSGVYFYQLAINGERLAFMKMIMIK